MSSLDPEQHELRLVIVVLGGASALFLDSLSLKDGELILGKVLEWTPRIRFHGLSVDPWADAHEAELVDKLLSEMDGMVLTDALSEGTHYSSAAVERLVRTFWPGKGALPVAIFGGPALAQEWVSLSGLEPVFVGEPIADNVMPALKAVVKVLLKKLPSTGKTLPPPSVR